MCVCNRACPMIELRKKKQPNTKLLTKNCFLRLEKTTGRDNSDVRLRPSSSLAYALSVLNPSEPMWQRDTAKQRLMKNLLSDLVFAAFT